MTRRSLLGIASGAAAWAGARRTLRAGLLAGPERREWSLVATPVKVPADFVGMHAHRWPGSAEAPTYDFGAARSHDHDGVAWCEIHRAPGEYVWERLDRWVAAHSARRRTLVYTLYGTPAWIARRADKVDLYGRPGGASAPRALEPLSEFVKAMCERYNAGGERRIACVETWNEPHFDGDGQGFWWGSAEELVAVGRAVYLAAKGVDTQTRVLSPGFVGDLAGSLTVASPHLRMARTSPMYQYLAASDAEGRTGAAWCDAIAFHTYNTALDGANTAYAQELQRVKAMLGMMQVNKPLVNTECGFIAPHPFHDLSAEEQGKRLKRMGVVQAALGVQGLFFYSHDDDFVGDPSRHPEVARALQQLHETVAGTTLKEASLRQDGSVRFRTAKGTVSW